MSDLAGGVLVGTVADFDDDVGFGSIRDADDRQWFVHCTGVADGSRHLTPGDHVAFRVVPGRAGRWEATDVRPAA